ncbi:MAG: DUF2721 domain-containing protein [Cyanobacteria bacterium M_surface_10_m2_179]|nr:DUF2721 domain-containing protein [Cyanobacteria bacterium M_surface_10_m2_179]
MTLLALIAAPQAGAPVMGLAKAIQLSVAPVFLLTAIAGVLGVISNRLARVLDRAREIQGPATDSQDMQLLRRRMGLLSRAIESVTITGVLVSAVVAVTFISAITVVDLAAIVVPLFVVAMLALIAGLLLLLLDTRLASRMMRRRF